MTDPDTTKTEALAAIARERASWNALVAEVGESRMLEPGPMGEWTFQDLTAHLTGWRNRTLDRLEAAARREPEPPPPWPADLEEDDPINAWIHEQSRGRSTAEVLAEAATSFDRLAAVVEALPEAALTDPNRFAWMEGHALGPVIIDGSIFAHLHEEH